MESLLRRLQLAELDILNEIDRLCNSHGINYYLDCGTALGAVRHAGFIPWDDDIDIAMMREDYDKFLEIAESNLSPLYFLQTIKTDKGYNKLHAKVRKNNTLFLEEDLQNRDMHKGIFVDIFPIDYINPKLYKLVKFVNNTYQRMFSYKYSRRYGDNIFKTLLSFILVGNNPQDRYDFFCKNVGKPIHGFTVSLSSFYEEQYLVPLNVYDNKVYIKFENRNYPIMAGYDIFLTIWYGDYMKLPPKELRVNHNVHEKGIKL